MIKTASPQTIPHAGLILNFDNANSKNFGRMKSSAAAKYKNFPFAKRIPKFCVLTTPIFFLLKIVLMMGYNLAYLFIISLLISFEQSSMPKMFE